MALKDRINDLLAQVSDMKASNAEEIEALRIKYLSKKGEITALFNEFREVPNILSKINILRRKYS